MNDRPSPSAVEAERALLGGVLRESTWLLELLDLVEADDFYRPEHVALWRLFNRMSVERIGVDLVTVMERIRAEGDKADRYGGAGYVAELPEYCPSTVNLRHYADAIVETARLRQLLAFGERIQRTALDRQLPAQEVIDAAVAELGELGASRSVRFPIRSWPELLERRRERVLEREQGGVTTHVSTGFRTSHGQLPSLDDLLGGGMRAGDQIVIAGASSMGKSSLARSIAARVAASGRPVAVFSLEMDADEAADGISAHLTKGLVPIRRLSESLDEHEQDLVDRTSGDHLPVNVWWRPGASADQVATMARRLWAQGRLGLLVVDYLQIMHHDRERGESTASAVGRTSTRLKQLAGELRIPLILLSQLNREFRPAPLRSKTRSITATGPWWEEVELPSIEQLQESGRIEQDADVILFPVNAPRYGLNRPHDGAIVIGKQRKGPRGIVPVRWDGPSASYYPLGEGR